MSRLDEDRVAKLVEIARGKAGTDITGYTDEQLDAYLNVPRVTMLTPCRPMTQEDCTPELISKIAAAHGMRIDPETGATLTFGRRDFVVESSRVPGFREVVSLSGWYPDDPESEGFISQHDSDVLKAAVERMKSYRAG